MWSEVAMIFCALLALQASLGYCLPTGQSDDMHLESSSANPAIESTAESEEEDGYQIILQSPTQVLKVEVVDAEGNVALHEMEIHSSEDNNYTENVETLDAHDRKPEGDEETTYKTCNWRRLYRLYLAKIKGQAAKKVRVSKTRRKEIRDAFKIVCDNPEEVITHLLNLDR